MNERTVFWCHLIRKTLTLGEAKRQGGKVRHVRAGGAGGLRSNTFEIESPPILGRLVSEPRTILSHGVSVLLRVKIARCPVSQFFLGSGTGPVTHNAVHHHETKNPRTGEPNSYWNVSSHIDG